MLNWVHVWTPSWPVHDINILLVQKGCRVTCCMWRGIVLDVHKVTSKHPRRPWQHLIHQDRDVPMRREASISPLAGPGPEHRDSSLKNRDSSLKIQCLHCLRSHTLRLLPHSRRRRLCSKVSLGHLVGRWDQYPAARSRLRMVRTDIRLPNRRIICIHRRGAEMKRLVLTIRSSWRSSRGVEIFIEPPRFLWCGRPVSWLRRKILLMHPWDTLTSWILLTENCHLPTTWHFAAVFALANFVEWSPLKVQRNISSLYRSPTLHKSIKVVMAKQT